MLESEAVIRNKVSIALCFKRSHFRHWFGPVWQVGLRALSFLERRGFVDLALSFLPWCTTSTPQPCQKQDSAQNLEMLAKYPLIFKHWIYLYLHVNVH